MLPDALKTPRRLFVLMTLAVLLPAVWVVGVSDAGTATEQGKLTSLDGAASDDFGQSVSIDGDTAVVGARKHDHSGTNSGSAYVFVRSGTSWTQQAELTASDGDAGDFFGWSVSIDGDTVLVGAVADDDDGSGSGSAYVFVRSGTTWTQQAKLTASDARISDSFGNAVSVDSDTALIAASHDDDEGNQSGSAYVFVRTGSTWTEQSKLTAGDHASRFLRTLSIHRRGHGVDWVLSG